MTGVERMERMLLWGHELDLMRYEFIRSRHPGAAEAELMALWTEQTYRGSVDPGFLARACAAIRATGDTAG